MPRGPAGPSGRRPSGRRSQDRGGEVGDAGRAMLERQAQPRRPRAGEREQIRIVGLRQEHDPGVVGEVRRQELRDGDRSRGRGSRAARSCGRGSRSARTCPARRRPSPRTRPTREHLVAVGARQALDPGLGQDRLEQAAGAAVGIGDEDPLVAVARGRRAIRSRTAPGIPSGRLWRSGGRQATSRPGTCAVTSSSSRASAPQPITRARPLVRRCGLRLDIGPQSIGPGLRTCCAAVAAGQRAGQARRACRGGREQGLDPRPVPAAASSAG